MNNGLSSLHSRFRRACRWSALCLAPIALGAQGANLVVNGAFDTDVSSWPLMTWDGTRDADGKSTSGSGQVTVQQSGSGTVCSNGIQCVAVTAGVAYDFLGTVLVPSGAATTGTGFANLNFDWSSGTCGAFNLVSSGSSASFASADDTWKSLGAVNQVAPPAARSVQIYPHICLTTAGRFTANFDNLALQPNAGNAGVCGGDNGKMLTAPPTDLCAAGTPTAVAGSGPWTWTCTGAPNTSDAACSANIARTAPAAAAPTAGIVSLTLVALLLSAIAVARLRRRLH